MRLVVTEEHGVVALNYTWLPTWLGINHTLSKELGKILHTKFFGMPITEDTLELMHREVMDFICAKNPGIGGLRDYLDALKYVYLGDPPRKDESNVCDL